MMNFVLGFVVLLVLVITSGKLGSTTVAQFTDNAQSCADGLREGDTILKVDGQVCRTIGDLSGCFDGTTQTHDFTVLLEWPGRAPAGCYGRSFYRCRRQHHRY